MRWALAAMLLLAGPLLGQSAPPGSAGLSNVVEDVTPQLGGTLDVNEKPICDGDADTCIALEEATDDDTIRLDVQGMEVATFTNDLTNVLFTLFAEPDQAGSLLLLESSTGYDWFKISNTVITINEAAVGTGIASLVFFEDGGGGTASFTIDNSNAAGPILSSAEEGDELLIKSGGDLRLQTTRSGYSIELFTFGNIALSATNDGTDSVVKIIEDTTQGATGDVFIVEESDGTDIFTVDATSTDIANRINLDFNSAGTAHNLSMVPSGTIAESDIWHGLDIDLSALDPTGTGAETVGIEIDLSGVSLTNDPIMHGLEITVPVRKDAIHIHEGQSVFNNTPDATATTEFHAIDIRVDTTSLAASSVWSAIGVTAVGGSSGEVDALLARNEVAPIRHEDATFSTANQTEYAGRRTGGGTTWADGIDGVEIFVVDDDEILIGSTAQFSQIEIIMGTPATKDVQPSFHYNTAADTWTEFFPDDETSGFQTSSLISWVPSSISSSWTNDGDPGGADSSTGFWIRIIRTRNADPGTPTPTTVKHGTVVEYKWDKDGAILAKDYSFEGSTDDANQTLLTVVDPTADRTITFKNESGTVALINSAGVMGTDKVTSDPCVSGEPEGGIFYNDTSNYMCFCDGTNDVQMHDPSTACF